MANVIQIKRGSGAPGSLADGELGFDKTNNILYIGKGSSVVALDYVKRSGDTMTGNLTIHPSATGTGGAGRVVINDNVSNGSMLVGFGTGHQYHGLYSSGYAPTNTTWTDDGQYMVYRNSSGDIILNGIANVTERIKVNDTRGAELSVNQLDKQAEFYFTNTGTPTGSGWWSGIHVNGWTGDYNAWEVMGPAHNSDQRTIPLYIRSGRTSNGWGTWRKIYDSSNFPTFKYGITSGNSAKIKVSINSTVRWMLSFVVTLYQGYNSTKIMVSGYNYGDNHWYSPQAIVIGDTTASSHNVYFGYDSVDHMWVAFDGANYTGVSVTDIVNGYNQIPDWNNLFSFSLQTTLSGTTQTTVVAESNFYLINAQKIWAGNDSSTTERDCGARAASGAIYFWASGDENGNRGIWLPAHGTGDAKAVITVNKNNYITYAGGTIGASTMSGVLTMLKDQYTDSYSGALNMNNSDIYGLNSIYTADAAGNASEGIHFYRDSTHVDTLWVGGGEIYFVPNRALGTGTTAANSQKIARYVYSSSQPTGAAGLIWLKPIS